MTSARLVSQPTRRVNWPGLYRWVVTPLRSHIDGVSSSEGISDGRVPTHMPVPLEGSRVFNRIATRLHSTHSFVGRLRAKTRQDPPYGYELDRVSLPTRAPPYIQYGVTSNQPSTVLTRPWSHATESAHQAGVCPAKYKIMLAKSMQSRRSRTYCTIGECLHLGSRRGASLQA